MAVVCSCEKSGTESNSTLGDGEVMGRSPARKWPRTEEFGNGLKTQVTMAEGKEGRGNWASRWVGALEEWRARGSAPFNFP